MKNKKLLSLVAGVALLSNFALAGLAFAETTNSDQPMGTVGLAIASFPAAENFASVNASSGAITSTVDFVAAMNIRGAVTLANGLELGVTGTPWYSTSNYGDSFASTALSLQTATAGGVTAIGTPKGVICSDLDDVTSFTALADAGGGDGSVTDQSGTLKIIDEATTGLVNFDCVFNPQLSLVIPAGQVPVTYRTTLTFTLSDL